tara:strand:- start:1748 stop:2221 length:474 start_codon:yes stop_codon:yes gene_type:complete
MSYRTYGLGYKGACQLRLDEGYTTQQQDGLGYEEPGHERFCLYFGRSHILDHETGVRGRGLLKVGRTKYLSALTRSRNQPGNDFRIYYAIYVPNKEQYKKIEEVFKKKYKSRNVPADPDEGQTELYNIKDEEIKQIVDDMTEHCIDINLNPKAVSYV